MHRNTRTSQRPFGAKPQFQGPTAAAGFRRDGESPADPTATADATTPVAQSPVVPMPLESKVTEQGTTGLQVDLSSNIEVYAANQESLLVLPRSDIISMPSTDEVNIKIPQPCPQFDAKKGINSCPQGSKCKFVHAVTDNATSHHIHVNYAWSNLEDVTYERFPPGTVLSVAPPNASLASDEIPSHLALKTRALQSNRRVISHCAHYYFNRTCNRGPECFFLHALSLAPLTKGTDASRRQFGHTQTAPKKGSPSNSDLATSTCPQTPQAIGCGLEHEISNTPFQPFLGLRKDSMMQTPCARSPAMSYCAPLHGSQIQHNQQYNNNNNIHSNSINSNSNIKRTLSNNTYDMVSPCSFAELSLPQQNLPASTRDVHFFPTLVQQPMQMTSSPQKKRYGLAAAFQLGAVSDNDDDDNNDVEEIEQIHYMELMPIVHASTPLKRQHNPYSWTRTTIVSA